MSVVDVTKLTAYKNMPTLKSKDTAWLAWMKALVSKYGEDSATTLFLKLWAKRGSQEANTAALRHELSKKYKIEINESIFNKVADVGAGIGRTASGIFKAGKITVAVIGGVILLATLSVIINVIRTGKVPVNPMGKR